MPLPTSALRLLATLGVTFGIYWFGAYHGDVHGGGLRSFYVATVFGRLFLALAFGWVGLGSGVGTHLRRGIWFLAVVNVVGALSTARAVRQDDQDRVAVEGS